MAIKYVIQARENSSRFPGKCFSKINGVSILQLIVEACEDSKHYKKGAVCFVIPKEDQKLIDMCTGYDIYHSTNKDCLSGYLQIGEKEDILVRLTADSPLITTEQIDLNIDKVLEGYEYASNEMVMFGDCCEAFTKDALIKYHDRNIDAEHVTTSTRNYSNRWIPSLMIDYPESIQHIEEFLNA